MAIVISDGVGPLAAAPDGVGADDWAAACAEVRAYCRWHIAPVATETVTVDGTGSSAVLLPTLNLQNLSSITNDGTAVTDPEWSESGVVRGNWTAKFRGVVADITHGYTACPPEVLTVVKALASRIGQSTQGRVRQVGQVAYQLDGDGGGIELYESEKRVLDRYRLPLRP